MSKKRLLFIEDLYDFYLSTYKRSTHFDAKESGSPLVVQVHGKINYDKSEKDTEGLLPVHLQSCHTNLNVNGSFISDSVMSSALPSFSNRPILGYIHKVTSDEHPDGQWEFYSHNIHEEDGEIVYDEIPIGIIPESCNAQLVYDEDKKENYCEVDGYLYEEYSKAAEILQREEECAVSVELSIRELSYNAKQKYLDIEDFYFSGVTILGKTPMNEDVNPGMKGSNIKLADFSAQNNSLFTDYENKMIEFQERLSKLESACSNTIPIQEGGNNTSMNLFEELLQKYNKTVEDITFEYAELTDEELTAKFEEEFGEETNDNNADGSDGTNPEPSTDDGEGSEPDGTSDEVENSNADDDAQNQFSASEDKMVRSFEISHEDIRWGLYSLLDTVSETDNTWYYIVNVFDDYFVYETWDAGKVYGQKYTVEDDNVAFDGERYELFVEYLTESEKVALTEMRSNYSSILAQLNSYKESEDISDKLTIFEDESYAAYLETDTFKELMKEETLKKFTKEELIEKADAALGKAVKETKTFAFKPAEETTKKRNKITVFSDFDTAEDQNIYGDYFKSIN
jgi:hypothetical protein